MGEISREGKRTGAGEKQVEDQEKEDDGGNVYLSDCQLTARNKSCGFVDERRQSQTDRADTAAKPAKRGSIH